jgi:hypothetical protein
MNRKLLFIPMILCSLLYFAGLLRYSTTRPVDGDEGYYTTAARLVWEGKAPYRDFFYQQAPLLPYLYSWIYGVRPHSLIAMRWLSALSGALTVCLWGLFLFWKNRFPADLAWATFALVVLNPYWMSWHVVVKTYAVADLLISAALICFYIALHSAHVRWYFPVGCALGLCASVRSLYGPIIPFVLIWLLCRRRQGLRVAYARTVVLLAGAATGLLPLLIGYLRKPSAFLFDNIRYHSLDAGYMWLDGQLIEGYRSLAHVLLLLAAHVGVGLFVFHPYLSLEIFLAMIGVVSWIKVRQAGNVIFSPNDDLFFQIVALMLVVYTLTALVPFPPYEQYFDSPLIPFLIPFVIEGLRVTLSRSRTYAALLLVSALFLVYIEVPRESAWNSNAPEWRVSSYQRVSRLIEANSAPRETILSFWPGYVFESGRSYWPGVEDNFIYRITNKISSRDQSRYHVASINQVMRAICDDTAPLIVFGPDNIQKEFNQNLSSAELWRIHAALRTNYVLLDSTEGVEVYRRLEKNQLDDRNAVPVSTINDN